MNEWSSSRKVPDWARDAIWYQIFPERFRNGLAANDPQLSDISDHPVPGWAITPWGRDWYAPDQWAGEGRKSHHAMLFRRYGGDLLGIRDKLDYLQDLGVNALYLNPVFFARSLHKYDGASFHHIDPTFGPDREGDLRMLAESHETDDPATWCWTAADRYFLELVADVHSRGMHIIIDGVFNHTGREFFAFQDILKHGQASRYADWYLIQKWEADGTFQYKGWFGHQTLPEFNRTEDNLLPAIKNYLFNITRRWMDPVGNGDTTKGIDGWRLDVAFCVPHPFWQEWREQVKALNPEAYITAEIVGDAKDYLQGDEFDAVMNYMWLYPAADYFAPGEKPLLMNRFKQKLDTLRARYPAEVTDVLQNLLDSHDVGRIASMFENPNEPKSNWDDYFNVSRVKHNPRFRTTKPGTKAYDALKRLVIFQVTYPGAPMIYYGTEVGMWGANDPDDRQPMLWEDVDYEDEQHTPTGNVDMPNPKTPDMALWAFFRRAFQLRHCCAALRRGSFEWVSTHQPGLLAFTRSYEGQQVLICLNKRNRDVSYCPASSYTLDLWTNRPLTAADSLTIPSGGWRITAT